MLVEMVGLPFVSVTYTSKFVPWKMAGFGPTHPEGGHPVVPDVKRK
jgi:hypothetical protein